MGKFWGSGLVGILGLCIVIFGLANVRTVEVENEKGFTLHWEAAPG